MASGTPAIDAARPLDEAWWTCDAGRAACLKFVENMPPDDVPILAPYEKTQPGFELVVAAACGPDLFDGFYPDHGDGYLHVCLWNIFEHKTDPAETDPQKQKINEMQRALGAPEDDTRLIRLQIACMRRCFWAFPGTLDMILDGIGRGRVNLDGQVSCEPPWSCSVLPLLRHRRRHPAARETLDDSREALVRHYLAILTWWLAVGDLESLKRELPEQAELAEIIYRRLGAPTKLKCLQVGRLRAGLSNWAFPTQYSQQCWDRVRELEDLFGIAIREQLGGEPDRIEGLIKKLHNGLCHHGFFRRLDHIIAHIGAGQPVALPGAGRQRKRVHDAVTNYVHALGSWLAGRTPQEAVSIWAPSEEAVTGVYRELGDVTPLKRWLVACLWKTLQDTDAHLGRGPLDEQPERFALPADVMPEQFKPPVGWCATAGRWSADEAGRILGESRGDGYLYRIEEHGDDVRVTATMRAVAGNEITVWICGSREKTELDGYTLAVSTEKAKLQRQGKDVATDQAVTIQPGRDHVLAFERRRARLGGFLDGAPEPFIEWTDPEPLRGPGHRTLGFYVWDGVVAVSNVKVQGPGR